MRQEVNYLSERLELFRGMVENKIRMQSRGKENNCGQIFEEMKELEEKQLEEALRIVHKIYFFWRSQNERHEARRLQRLGSSRRIKEEATRRTFSLFSHAGHRRWITSKRWVWSLRERFRTYKW